GGVGGGGGGVRGGRRERGGGGDPVGERMAGPNAPGRQLRSDVAQVFRAVRITPRRRLNQEGEDMGNLSLRTKLLGSLLGVGLLTLLVTGWQVDRRAEAALRQAAINQLTAIREERRLEVE